MSSAVRHCYGAAIDGRTNKVAAVTGMFWLLKILATTLGETSGDMLSLTFGWGYIVSLAVALVFLACALLAQVSGRRFIPALFWLTIVATTVAGTEIADALDRSLGVGYLGGVSILLTGLLLVLGAWQWLGNGIRTYPILRRRTELFYWAAILASNTLGTAVGDYLTDSAGLDYLTASGITALTILCVYAIHRLHWIPTALGFWMAFVMTRPFGATFGDFLTKPVAQHGLALDTSLASTIALGLMMILLAIAYRQHWRQWC